ncbi:type I restriction endonuclease subunit R, EcoR124 family [Flammeovirga aprica]|uniref:type I restriction endonuclease subunit R, EcoR124 family n=1 Tax=Flammeovirga aprica TaxID=29528 RepID=UPI00293BA289|nr:hypothetical protein [Flammeovirga aprica]
MKKNTDDAISLFSNKDANEIILLEPYENYIKYFDEALKELQGIAPTVESVDELLGEEDQLEFVKAFRELMRLKNVLGGFADFDFDDLQMSEQEFEDYKSKYLDIHDSTKGQGKEKVSILDDVDFELELIHRDEINVSYILRLLGKLHALTEEQKAKQRKAIVDMMAGEAQLRSKKGIDRTLYR